MRLSPARISGEIALRDGEIAAVVGQRFQDHVEIRIAAPTAEDRTAAHAVERLEHHVTVLGDEAFDLMRIAGDERGRDTLRKMQREQFFVGVAQRLRIVDDQHAGALRQFQHHRVVEELLVERRILARQDHVDLAQVTPGSARRA